MAFADDRAVEQRAQGRGRVDLALVAAQRVDIRMERRRRAHGGIGRQRAGDQRRLRGTMGAEQAGQRQRGRDLRAVDQRQAFLGGQHDRLQAGCGESAARRHALAVEEGFALAHHHRRHMRERRKIAGSADRALFRDDRDDALFQHASISANDVRPDAGSAAPERDELQRHDQADDVFGSGSPTPQQCDRIRLRCRVATSAACDLDRGEFAEAGIDAIDRLVAGGDLGDARRRLGDAGVEGRIEPCRLAVPVDRFECRKRYRAGVKYKRHLKVLFYAGHRPEIAFNVRARCGRGAG